MGCGSSLDAGDGHGHSRPQPEQKKKEPVVLDKADAQKLVWETQEAARKAAVPALLALLARRPKTVELLKVSACTADDARVKETCDLLMSGIGRGCERYEKLVDIASVLEELGTKLIRQGVGNRFFREFGELLVAEMEAAPPPQPATPAPADGDGAPAAAPVAWTEAHGHAWRQVFGDISGFVAHGVATGRPTASATNLTKSAEIVKAAWQEHVAANVGDCGVKSYLAMFKNDPETLSVFFFKDSLNLAKDGRMREHVTKSFTVTGQMINLATRPVEFREKMERLGAAHGMKGVSKAFVEALGRGILVMLAEVMEDDFTPQVEAAFKRVLKEVADMFDSGLKLWKSGAAPSASITGCAPPEFRRDYYADLGKDQASKPRSLQ